MSAILLPEVRPLAAGFCQDHRIEVELHPQRWAYDWARHRIVVGESDLERGDRDLVCGILCHEAAHAFASRYSHFNVSFPSKRALALLLNSIEEPRVNLLSRLRFPGSETWIRRAHRVHAPRSRPVGWVPDFLVFCVECVLDEERGFRPLAAKRGVSEPVLAALERTLKARVAYAKTIPSPGPDVEAAGSFPNLEERYEREVVPRLADPHGEPISRKEMAVRLSALEALRIAEKKILPVAARLLRADRRHLERKILEWAMSDASGQDASKLSDLLPPEALTSLLPRLLERPDFRSKLRARSAALLDALLSDDRLPAPCAHRERASSDEEAEICEVAEEPDSPVGRDADRHVPSFDEMLVEMEPQVASLTGDLEALLRPERSFRSVAGFPSGDRVCLRRLQAFEADRRRYDQVWMRKRDPRRRDVSACLLVDLSGSMRGAKIEAAMRGAVLVASALDRLAIDFAVMGFQDVVIPICDFGEPLDDHSRRAIAEMRLEVNSDRPGGNNQASQNNDGPCVAKAAELLLERDASTSLLVVISDGQPAGRGATPEDLKRVIANLSRPEVPLVLVGIGLGPDTKHVDEYYPNAIAQVHVRSLAHELGGLLREVLAGEA